MKRTIAVATIAALAASGTTLVLGYSVRLGNDHMYEIDLTTGLATDLGSIGLDQPDALAADADTIYGYSSVIDELWDVTTQPGNRLIDLDPRPFTKHRVEVWYGVMYGVMRHEATSFATQTMRINLTDGSWDLEMPDDYFDGLAVRTSDGQFYGMDTRHRDGLWELEVNSLGHLNTTNLVGSFGLGDINVRSGATFGSDGKLYMLFETGELYTVSTTTGAATFVAAVHDSSGNLDDWGGLASYNQIIPEPASFAVLGVGLVGLLARRRSRKRA